HRRTLARIERRERQSLEKAVKREQRLQEAARLERERTAEQARTVENMAKQDFFDAARDQGLWKQRDFEEGEISRTFNDEAGFVEGPPDSGDDDDGLTPDRSTGFDDDGGDDDSGAPRHRRRRGKGYGYRRDSE
ncbi:MAG: hypothetical protein ACRD4B_06660, partial [Acidobacteriota bacterium]